MSPRTSSLYTFLNRVLDLYWLLLPLPLATLTLCLLYAFLYNLDRTTRTHCNAANFAMSISAATAEPWLSKTAWQASVLLHTPSRLVLAASWFRHLRRQRPRSGAVTSTVLCATAAVEVASLVGLTMYTAEEDFDVHQASFVVFVASAVVFMIGVDVCKSKGSSSSSSSSSMQRLLSGLTKLMCCSFVLMTVLYWRHNEYCDPYAYSLFCLVEYAAVYSNMWFHVLSPWLFRTPESASDRDVRTMEGAKDI